MRQSAKQRAGGGRRGSFAVELILVLPILLALILAVVEFSMLLAARQQLQAASREGARVAALGGSLTDVQQAARRILGGGNLGQAQITATLTDPNTGQPVRSGDPIQVCVRLPAHQAVPDFLAFVGISIRNQQLVACTVMRKE
ncbi:MAG: hypothetical protein C4297_01210 [Gemmataceae bacterium]